MRGREGRDGVRWGREKVRKRIEEENSKKYVHIYIYILTCVHRGRIAERQKQL